MQDEVLVDIVGLCLSLDAKSYKIYSKLAEAAETQPFHQFWADMAAEEKTHIEFWKNLVTLARDGVLPPVFDDPTHTRHELEVIDKKIDTAWNAYTRTPSLSAAFLLAYRLEFSLLHPAIEMLFHYMKDIESSHNPEDSYEAHLNKFIDALRAYGNATPELELLGETLTSLWRRNRQLARQSTVDELTDLLNRRGFFNAITPLLHLSKRNQYPIGIAMADIDNFKHVNDTYGHQQGDAVLKTVAKQLKANRRSSDIIGRFGGEEFIIFFSAIDRDSIYPIAEKIRRAIEQDSTGDIKVTVSMGIAQGIPKSDVQEAIMELIKRADNSLYRAKNSGKNRVVMDD